MNMNQNGNKGNSIAQIMKVVFGIAGSLFFLLYVLFHFIFSCQGCG
jgi:hypothetical protein